MILIIGRPLATTAVATVRISVDDALPEGSIHAMVFDLGAAAVADFMTYRAKLEGVPLLLVSDTAIPESAVSLLRADDTFVLGLASGAALERRLSHFIELGRARAMLADQERFDAERQRFERLAAMGTMVAGFAHEVRNPVAAMRSLCEELRDEGITLPHVGLMLQMVERIERLVRTSLQFGRPAAPRRSLRRPTVIAKSALDELRSRLRTKHEDIVVETEPDLPDVNVDERQIAQALVILLDNALDATGGSPSRVVLRVRKGSPRQLRFEVIDDGPGIAAANLSRIFDPFFTTKSSGTGLGLSIAQQIVNENGARLEVESYPPPDPRQTTFTIILPTDPISEQREDRHKSLFRY
jgi:signal transduction histidine kinase